MKNILLTAGLAALLLAGCSKPAETAAPEAKADKARLEADVRYLASDELEGREAGTPGYDKAASYVADRYSDLGLEPGGGDGTYYQQVPMRSTKIANPEGGALSFSGDGAPQDIAPAVDYFVGASAKEIESAVEAPLVFVGYGFVSEDHGRDDYAGLDVEGKIVVSMFGAPKFLNTEERAHYRSTRGQRASERGAVGMITLFTPALAELLPVPDPFAYLVELSQGTDMTWLQEDGAPFSSAPNLRGSAILSPALSARLFEGQPATWADIVAAEESEDGVIEGFDMNMTARIAQNSVHDETSSPNVIGVLPGSDPKLKNEYVVLTGHLDHEGVKPTPEEGDDEIYNGAMDNAVGVSSIMEVARLLAANPPKRSVMFVALTAEEKGLVGSDYNARNPTVPAGGEVVANVNLDMPILTWEFTDVVAFGGERSTMYPVVEAAAERAGLTLTPDPQPEQGFFVRSDQYSYVKQGVPAVYLDLGWGNGGEEAQLAFQKDHYHKVSDEADLIDYDSMQRFTQVNYEIANGVANMAERPRWKKGDFFGRTFGGPMEE